MRAFGWTTLIVMLALGCSRQGEGERCDPDNGREGPDSDCDDGLVCTDSASLETSADICCPPAGQPATALACLGGTGDGGAGGSPSTGGAGGTTSVGGMGAGGMSAGGTGGTSTGGTGGTATGGTGGTSAGGSPSTGGAGGN